MANGGMWKNTVALGEGEGKGVKLWKNSIPSRGSSSAPSYFMLYKQGGSPEETPWDPCLPPNEALYAGDYVFL